jgi:hypothetical protein
MTLSYYSFNRILSFNAKYNFVVGGRGFGKTYGAKVRAISDALENGNQFIYLRRYKTEVVASKNTFFADIVDKFEDWDFRVQGDEAQASHVSTRDEKKRPWMTIGYFIALSTAQTRKSVAFPKVKTIIFDEFIIETGSLHYLPNEFNVFNNFYSTVDRWKDKTRVFFLANSVSIMNPYFQALDIEPDSGSDMVTKSNGFVAAHFPDSSKFASGVFETVFGKFIKGTEYAEYAVGNKFADNHGALLADKTSNAKYEFSLECKNGTFSVWFDRDQGEYYIQEKLPKQQLVFTLLAERMTEHKYLMTFSDRPLASLRTAFRQGKVTFKNPKIRNTFAEIFKR